MTEALAKKRTIVRSFYGARLVTLRTLFRVLDRTAPPLTVGWATRIWCTPPQVRPACRTVPDIRPGTRFTVPVGRSEVVAEAWGEEGRPVTYLLHGWGGWRGQLTGMVAPLVAAGQRVVALDAPGHGESGPGPLGGRRTTLAEVAAALAAVAATGGPPHAVVAHSGGANAAALAIRDGLVVRRAVFLAPMADPQPYLDEFGRLLGLGDRTRDRVRHRLERLVERPFSDFDIPGWAGRESPDLPPLLVIHDRADREVAHADGQTLAGAWPGATLHTTEGLGHRRIVADPDVVATTVSFLTGRENIGTGRENIGTGQGESDRQHPA